MSTITRAMIDNLQAGMPNNECAQSAYLSTNNGWTSLTVPFKRRGESHVAVMTDDDYSVYLFTREAWEYEGEDDEVGAPWGEYRVSAHDDAYTIIVDYIREGRSSHGA